MSQVYQETHTNGSGTLRGRVAVVGGGLVGCVAALQLAQKGYQVDLYESRSDIRTAEVVTGRSINLALSARGRKALAEVMLEDKILADALPMEGRMLHSVTGQTRVVPYDAKNKQCIYSVSRRHLNEVLLTATERYPNIQLHFSHKLAKVQHDTLEMQFTNPETKETVAARADYVVGADGAYSALRRQIMTTPGFDYSQTFIEHGYLELGIPATAAGEFAMPEKYLHIWPRGDFMMIALPNKDRSWTVTLFMPQSKFRELTDVQAVVQFFRQHFNDYVQLVGETQLTKMYFSGRPQPLVMVKCRPYHFQNRLVLLGDAAHAMVPFYGQGMNCGFEDCTVFSGILDEAQHNWELALARYSERRWEDAHAICDLAMYNYVEMRDLVNRPSYRLRKFFDDLLHKMMPGKWVPLYNSVSFSSMRYTECVWNRKWQDGVIARLLWSSAAVSVAAGVAVAAVAVSGKKLAPWW